MIVYLAGPMRGQHRFGFPAFDRAATHLRTLGFEVVSPAEMDRRAGFDECEPHSEDEMTGLLPEFFRRDCCALCDSDGIAVMPGWGQSRGVAVELALAQVLGLKVIDATNGVELTDSEIEFERLM